RRVPQSRQTNRRRQHRHAINAMIIKIRETLQAVGALELGIRQRRAQAYAGQSIGKRFSRSRRRAGLDPETAVVERLGRERHATAGAWLIESLPINVVTAAIKLAEARQDLVHLAALAERAEPGLCVFIHALSPKGKQGVTRPDFENVGHA